VRVRWVDLALEGPGVVTRSSEAVCAAEADGGLLLVLGSVGMVLRPLVWAVGGAETEIRAVGAETETTANEPAAATVFPFGLFLLPFGRPRFFPDAPTDTDFESDGFGITGPGVIPDELETVISAGALFLGRPRGLFGGSATFIAM